MLIILFLSEFGFSAPGTPLVEFGLAVLEVGLPELGEAFLSLISPSLQFHCADLQIAFL